MNAKKKFDHSNDLVLLPLGGVGEIGMNCYCYGVGPAHDREWLMVDLGVKFGDESEPGIDIVLPDLGHIVGERRRLSGLVLTHAHEDHLGAVAWLWPQLNCPVYCTPFAAEILAGKLKERGIDERVPVHVKPVGSRFDVGSFTVELVSVTHSIPEPTALFIETKQGRVLHSGDWKIDRTPMMGGGFDEKRFREIGELGVDALVCDSTNVFREGFSVSEAEVAANLDRIVSEAKNRIAVTTFASHVERISSAVAAARKAGREVVIAGRAMRQTIEAARACGYLRDAGSFLEEEAFGYLPPDKIMLLCTGSQGEPRAAIARIAEDIHPAIALDDGDLVVFSSKTIPGNEKAVSAVHNNLARLGVDVITSDDALVHTSGHPRQDELKLLYGWLNPRAVIPMHGEARHLLRHMELAEDAGIEETVMAENGDIVRLCPGPVQIVDEAPSGRLHVDGKLIVPAIEGPAKYRRKLSFVGIVVASLVIDHKGSLVTDIEIIADGLPSGLEERLRDAADEAFDSMPRSRRASDETVAETLRVAIRRAADAEWGKKPICRVLVHRL
ncbi:ribonuclease J [Nordella sp. HKS 07]|uniref:ribonuclease J n=1 Tax=Nordella sp. HKS 07 TaxID=2712222 RepID=UPI0013E12207|nr:ribonuclease J [Nordella sp. HKS 07]QIG50871.1 ribonuclease J [Nordella sp. HKS 07]